jgi:hypothetical protein
MAKLAMQDTQRLGIDDGGRTDEWEDAVDRYLAWEGSRPRWARYLFVLALPVSLPVYITVIGSLLLWGLWARLADGFRRKSAAARTNEA